MTPQERHYARLGLAEREAPTPSAPSRKVFFAFQVAAIMLGVTIGEISTAWIADQAERAVQETQ